MSGRRARWLLAAVLAAGCSAPVEDAPAQEDSGARNKLTWRAGSEAGVFGYLIYRSEDRAGPYLRINDEIVRVPADGEPDHRYTWYDEDVVPGTTYYYYLDVVTDNGVKQRFSGILSRTTGEPTS